MINFHQLKCIIHEKKSNVLYLSNKTNIGNLKKTNYINYFRLVRNYKYELFIYIYIRVWSLISLNNISSILITNGINEIFLFIFISISFLIHLDSDR